MVEFNVEQLRDVTNKIVGEFAPEQIILFGSFAYGQPNPDSEVDLLVIMNSTERPVRRSILISRLLRPRPFPMDILVRTPQEIEHRLKIEDPFFQEIMNKGIVLYERPSK